MKQRTPHPSTWFLLASIAVALVSWIANIYDWSVVSESTGHEVVVQSLLSPEGIRWMLRRVAANFMEFEPLSMMLIALPAIGVSLHSGFVEVCIRAMSRLWQHTLSLSRKEFRALLMAWVVGLLYVALLAASTFASWGILRGVTGGLERSPLADGWLFLLAAGWGLMSVVYGFTSDRYRSDTDVVDGFCLLRGLLCQYLVIAFFAAQLLSCLDYTQLALYVEVRYGIELPLWVIAHSPLVIAVWRCVRSDSVY